MRRSAQPYQVRLIGNWRMPSAFSHLHTVSGYGRGQTLSSFGVCPDILRSDTSALDSWGCQRTTPPCRSRSLAVIATASNPSKPADTSFSKSTPTPTTQSSVVPASRHHSGHPVAGHPVCLVLMLTAWAEIICPKRPRADSRQFGRVEQQRDPASHEPVVLRGRIERCRPVALGFIQHVNKSRSTPDSRTATSTVSPILDSGNLPTRPPRTSESEVPVP